jgi:hypothetical protein
MGPRGRHPDFVIVHPGRGLLVLEVKDWRLDTIASANKSEVELFTNAGVVRTMSPFEQARQYMFDVMKLIQNDGMLLHPPGHPYQGKSIVPFGYGAVFTNITRKQFATTDLHEVFPEDGCVFKDEMSESADAEEFRARLWSMVPRRLGSPMTLPEFDRLRGFLFPEIRIRQIVLPLEVKSPAHEDRAHGSALREFRGGGACQCRVVSGATQGGLRVGPNGCSVSRALDWLAVCASLQGTRRAGRRRQR